MTDEQNAAEQLDDTKIEPGPRTDDLPGVDAYVDIGPMSAEDPAQLRGSTEAPDGVDVREWREEPEPDADDVAVEERQVTSLLDVGDPARRDDENELLGIAAEPDDGRTGPEESALHIETENGGIPSS